jgi:hypothetical protein
MMLGRCPRTASRIRVSTTDIKRHIGKASVAMASATMERVEVASQPPSDLEESAGSDSGQPDLPYQPAFKVGDIVYGTCAFSNAKGARVDIMYHAGLIGWVNILALGP